MDNNTKDDLWQGGLWEQPSPVFPTPPAVHIPAARRSARPRLRTRRRVRKWPWIAGVTAVILLLCALALFLDANFTPTSLLDAQEALVEEQLRTQPPSIPQAKTGTGITLTLHASPEQALTLPEIYDKALPSLVSIEGTSGRYQSSGSGVIFTSDGYIVTNAHVVAGMEHVLVRLRDNRAFPASLVGFDAKEDLAVLKIDASGLTPAEFGSSNELVCGETVAALGDSLGYRATFTDGIVSALDREMTLDDGSVMALIQTSAAINFGNSGGPLLNQYGQVVGINTIKIVSDDGSAESLGFAIPSIRVKYVVDQLIAGAEVRTAVFGFTVSTVQLPGGGLELIEVNPASDAYRKGLVPGDIITSANGLPITGTEDLVRLKQTLGPGDQVSLTYERNGVSSTIDVVLMDAEDIS